LIIALLNTGFGLTVEVTVNARLHFFSVFQAAGFSDVKAIVEERYSDILDHG